MFILGLDPGQKEYGYALFHVSEKLRFIEAGMLLPTVKDLTSENFVEECRAHQRRLALLLSLADTKLDDCDIVFERYVLRALNSSTNSETAPCMMGLLAACSRESDLIFLTLASTWKGYVNRALKPLNWKLISSANKDKAEGFDNFYKEASARKIKPHILDAFLMGRVHAMLHHSLPLPTQESQWLDELDALAAVVVRPPKKRKEKT